MKRLHKENGKTGKESDLKNKNTAFQITPLIIIAPKNIKHLSLQLLFFILGYAQTL